MAGAIYIRYADSIRQWLEWVRVVSTARQGKVAIQELAHKDVHPAAVFCHKVMDIIIEARVLL